MFKKTLFFIAGANGFSAYAMETALTRYDIPYNAESGDTPGGMITLSRLFHNKNTGKKITVGRKTTAYEILEIPIQTNPKTILNLWAERYKKSLNLDNTDFSKITLLKAAALLNLPIPPEPRDTSNTPNYDAFMDKRREIFLKMRPTHMRVPIPRNQPQDPQANEASSINESSLEQNNQGSCTLL